MRCTPWLLLLLAACGGGTPAPQAPSKDAAVPKPASSEMTRHFDALEAARDALIEGDVLAARDKLAVLERDVSADGHPSEWASYLTRLQSTLRAGTYTSNPQSVGRAIAASAAVCGDCHLDLGARVDLPMPPAPKDNVGVIPHMRRHAWAADRMWAGLVGPSPGAWADAAAVLADKPLYEAPEGKLMSDAARTYAEQVVKDGVGTLTAASEERRIELYGDFLGA